MSKKQVMPSEAPKTEAEVQAIMKDAAVVPMTKGAKSAAEPTMAVDEQKLATQVRGKISFVIREGTEPVRSGNAGDNPAISNRGEVLHNNQVTLQLNPFGGNKK